MSANDRPCMGCEARMVGCHANCNKYIAFKARHEEALQKKASCMKNACDIYDYKRNCYSRNAGKKRSER